MMGLDQRMWGSNATLQLNAGNVDTNLEDTQLADIPLPQSCVASIFFQAELISAPTIPVLITSLTVTINQGLGRVSVLRPYTWSGVPSLGVPIQFTLPFVPVKMLLATVRARGRAVGLPGTPPGLVLCTLEAAPIGHFPMQEPLKFGMALPGEADGIDEGLREDLEADAPDEADVMHAAQVNGVDPRELAGAEDDESPEVLPVPPRLRSYVKRFLKRNGRPPKVRELPPWGIQALRQHLRGEGS